MKNIKKIEQSFLSKLSAGIKMDYFDYGLKQNDVLRLDLLVEICR